MKSIIGLIFIILVFKEVFSLSVYTPQHINFYEEAKIEKFNENEFQILKPLIDILQVQYDTLFASTDFIRNFRAVNESELNNLLITMQSKMVYDEESTFNYNISLPNISSLKLLSTTGLSPNEAEDIQQIFQETFDDAHQTIQNLIEISNDTEVRLISISKIKIIKFIYRMTTKIYALGIRGGRTAYCTYSHYPAINSTLTEGSINIGSCYNYTETSIGRLRRDVNTAITEIRENVQELIGIYKKIQKRESLLGKLLTVLLNMQRITRDIKESKSAAIATVEEIKSDGPIMAATILECATTSIPSFVTQLNDTITNLTTCINFVDDSTQGPEPEPESFEESFENLI